MTRRPLCLAAVFILGIQLVLVGVLQMAEDLKPSPLEQTAADGDMAALSGRVYRREERPDYQMFYLADVQIRRDKQIINESKILVYIKQNEIIESKKQNSEIIEVGNRIKLAGEVFFFETASNPGNFDRKFYYQKQGIHAAVWSEKAEVSDHTKWLIREGLTRLRLKWKAILTGILGEYYGNCMSAILLGDKSELDEAAKERYQKSGIGHVLAVSGLHMSFLGIGLYRLLRRMGLAFLPAGMLGILFLMSYTWMVGSGVSAQRALIMFLLYVGADMAGRDYDLPTSLALAAGIIVLKQPLYLFDAGFLLSFGALTGIAVVHPVLEKLEVMPRVFRASVSIQLVLLPLLLYYYFEVPLYSLVLNLLVIPLMPVILGAGVIGSAMAILWSWGGGILLQICKLMLWGYEQAAAFTMELPLGRLVLGQPKKWWCVAYYVILFLVCVVVKWKTEDKKRKDKKRNDMRRNVNEEDDQSKGHKKTVSCLVILHSIVFCVGCVWGHATPGELKITAIDMGQGEGLYIRSPAGKHYMIDGGSTSESQVGKYRMKPFLKSQGVGTLDYVFISHGDEDHISGVKELLTDQDMGIRIRTLVLPAKDVLDESLQKLAELAEQNGTRAVTMECGQRVSDGKITLTCLAPLKEYTGDIGNASSMVLELEYKAFEMLFTGDLEGEGEQQLLNKGNLRDYDVLKAGHHGSKNSTSEELLSVILPEITVISAGKENRYGHPHEETLTRLENIGSRVYCTKESGAVTIVTDGERVQMQKFLQ